MGMTGGGKLSRDEAALLVALALAAHYFPDEDHDQDAVAGTFRHAAFLLSGQYDKWSAWRGLPLGEKQRIAAAARIAPAEYASASGVTRAARSRLRDTGMKGVAIRNFTAVGAPETCEAVIPRVGGDLLAYADRILARTVKRGGVGGAGEPAGPGSWLTRTIYETGPGEISGRVDIPVFPAGETPEMARSEIAASTPEISIPVEELLAIATKLDTRMSIPYLHGVLFDLLAQVKTSDTMPASELLRLTAGPMEVFNAPTGTGKSVMVRVLGSWFTVKQMTVTLVLPTVEASLMTALEIREDLAWLTDKYDYGIDAASACVPLMSAYGLHNRAMKVVSRTEGAIRAVDDKVRWKLNQLSYGCAMKPFVSSTHPYPHGKEPCSGLRPFPPLKGTRCCPWMSSCGKYQQHHLALNANVIVTNHHNFMGGRMPIPVAFGDRPAERLSVEEFLLRRSHAILLDEVDQFQSIAVGKCSTELVLSSRMNKETFLPQIHRALKNRPSGTSQELIPLVAHAIYLTDFFLAAACQGQIHLRHDTDDEDEVKSTGWHIAGSRDRRLIRLLFPGEVNGDDHEMPEYLFGRLNELRPPRTVFGLSDDPHPDLERSEPLEAPYDRVRDTLTDLLSPRGDNVLNHAKHRLHELLNGLIADPHDRAEAITLLVIRTWLAELDDILGRLMAKLSDLKSITSDEVRRISERLDGAVGSKAIPYGMLGRALFGYRLTGLDDPENSAEFTSQTMTGDPHTYTAQLGSVVSLVAAGRERVVMGLSATAYFPEAVREHIHSEVKWWMTDAAPDSIRARRQTFTDLLNNPIQISGNAQHLKPKALKALGEALYRDEIHRELERLEREDSDRANVVLVANSYEHCRYLALGIFNAPEFRSKDGLCVAIPADQDARRDLPELPDKIIELTPDEFESFPKRGSILIVPMARIARGLNIVTGIKSAISSVYLCTRPLALLTDPAEMYASINAYGMNSFRSKQGMDPVQALAEAREKAWDRLSLILRSAPGFQSLSQALQNEIVAGMIVDMIQLAGRARRGGTDMTLHLVDHAFHLEAWQGGLATVLERIYQKWSPQERARMNDIYGEALAAFLAYAGIDPLD
ncbi:hypothetical protein [Streptomyces sp. NBC_01006]|uniref:hypothetical protein n=1 Tax=Streptomyces sp. NBC_01006 TaxID=2903716 RepID=UPI00386F97BC|nr:hypothetical protein OG509_31985 [Streptomyces sp. NBC_01006]